MRARVIARRSWPSSVLILLLVLSPACTVLGSTWLATPPPPSPVVPSPSAVPTPLLPTPSSVAAAAPVTLTVWAAAEFAGSGEPLVRHLEEYAAASPKLRVLVQPKGMQGKGGLVNLLAAAAPVAPSILPDAAIVSAAQAKSLAQRGLIHPWPELLPPDLEADLFPLAQQLGYYEGQRLGVPLALDVQHLAYRPSEVASPPLLWRDVLTGQALYLFPAIGKGEALDTFLIQYLGAGGRLSDDEGTPLLEEQPLTAALARYQGAGIARVIPPEALQLDSLAGCWSLYLTGQVGVAHVWSSHYLAEQPRLPDTSFAAIPSGRRTSITFGRGWLMVLVTEDPARQEHAAGLLGWWLSPQHNAALCRATSWLPPSHAAFAQWRGDDRYDGFVHGQLEVAVRQPSLPPGWAEALSGAIGQVLRGEQAAQGAAAQVMTVTSPP